MNTLVYDSTKAQWVTEHGWTGEHLDAKPFSNANEARKFCEARKDMDQHRIVMLKFECSEVLGLKQLFTKAARRHYSRAKRFFKKTLCSL